MGKHSKKKEPVIATPTTDFNEVALVTGIGEAKLRQHLQGRTGLKNNETRALRDAIGGAGNMHALYTSMEQASAPARVMG